MLKATITFLILCITMPLICGLYGMLHDQITFSLSNEYFTKFKYEQFQVFPEQYGSERKAVATIGFMATWWFGIPMALALSLFVLSANIRQKPLYFYSRAIGIIFIAVLLFFCIGYGYGNANKNSNPDWFFPEGLTDKPAFVLVGYIHNFGYLGGLLGLILAIVYLMVQVAKKKKYS